MKVPLLDVRQQNLALEEELAEAFRRALHSGGYINGPEIERFEKVSAAIA